MIYTVEKASLKPKNQQYQIN